MDLLRRLRQNVPPLLYFLNIFHLFIFPVIHFNIFLIIFIYFIFLYFPFLYLPFILYFPLFFIFHLFYFFHLFCIFHFFLFPIYFSDFSKKYFGCLPLKFDTYEFLRTLKMISESVRIFLQKYVIFQKVNRS